jgi:hypothetical protein
MGCPYRNGGSVGCLPPWFRRGRYPTPVNADHCQPVTALTEVPSKARYSYLDVYAE